MESNTFVDLYKLLNVSRDASSKEIEEACLRLAEDCRPDKHPDSPAAAGKFAMIERAYATLTNPKSREDYDRAYFDRTIAGLPLSPNATSQSTKRTGILMMATSIAAAGVAIVAALNLVGPAPNLGIITVLQLATFRLLSYEPRFESERAYLIQIDAMTVLLLCFLLGMYGLLVFFGTLPGPSAFWKRLRKLLS